MIQSSHNQRIVALDVGTKRIGVASANVIARLASPLVTLPASDAVFEQINQLLTEQDAIALVVGLPRGLDGQDTDQTRSTRAFVARLKQHVSLPIHMQDEALTSHVSKLELQAKKGTYTKADVDALAATYILEDFLAQNRELTHV